MMYGHKRRSPKRLLLKGKVLIDVEPWQCMALDGMQHWCFNCKHMRKFALNEKVWEWNCERCGHTCLLQQLIIEGRVSESKYRGIESA